MYRIRRAAELAGVTPELLRAWERRYALVAPVRTDSGYRVYSDDDVRVLRGAKRLVDGGQSIALVARRPREDLLAAAAGEQNPPNTRSTAAGGNMRLAFDPLDLKPAFDECLSAIAAFEQDRLEATLFRVIGMGLMSPEEICEQFLLPLLQSIGEGWENGSLSIAAEHFGSGIIRSKILRLIEHERAKFDAPAMVCACPPSEEHEGALLAFAVSASRAGYRIIYLGADTPILDIIRAAERTGAPVIALSITRVLGTEDVHLLVAALEGWRMGAPNRHVLVGGRGAISNRRALEAAGLKVAERIDAGLVSLSTPAPQ